MQERGYTEDILYKIRSAEARTGPRLWSDVKLASQRHQLKAETQALREEKAALECGVIDLKTQTEEETALVRSEANKLDDLKLQTTAFGEMVAAIDMFQKDGYSATDLKCLKLVLDSLGLKNKPRPSIERLLQALREEKSLATLSEKVERKNEELTNMNDACERLRKNSQLIQQTTVKAIEETRDASLVAIAATAKHGEKAAETSTGNL